MTGWIIAAAVYVLAWPLVGLLFDLAEMWNRVLVGLGRPTVFPGALGARRRVRLLAVALWPLGALVILLRPSRPAFPSPSSTGDDDG